MAKNSVRDYSATASLNTDVQSVDIDEGCAPSGINNAIREVMADIKNVSTGAIALESPAFDTADINGGTVDGAVIGGTTPAAGTFTTGQFNTSLNVTGTVTADGLTVDGGITNFGIVVTSSDQFAGIAFADNTTTNNATVAVYADGNNLGFEAGNAERMRIDSSGNVGIGTSSPDVEMHLSASDNATLRLESTDTSITANQVIGAIEWEGNDTTAGSSGVVGKIDYIAEDATPDYAMRFFTQQNISGTADFAERMRIDSSGDIRAGTTSAISTESFTFYTSASIGVAIRNPASGAVRFPMIFVNGSTTVGSITSSASSTSFNTSSDYRLKENVTGITDGIERVKQLNPSRFNFIADADTTVDGFLAHEAATVVPEAVTGEKDAVDADGNPEYQGIDQAKLVPLLTAALQEAITKIEELEARVATLEGN